MGSSPDTQSLDRSLNEILILATLQAEPKHGYQIAVEIEERSDGFFSFKHGTLYPILHHLEKEGLIDGNWDAGQSRRRKKEYLLTPEGRLYLRQRVREWEELHGRLSAFVVESAQVRPGLAANQ